MMGQLARLYGKCYALHMICSAHAMLVIYGMPAKGAFERCVYVIDIVFVLTDCPLSFFCLRVGGWWVARASQRCRGRA